MYRQQEVSNMAGVSFSRVLHHASLQTPAMNVHDVSFISQRIK